jgi:hypothetical protein
MAVVKIPNYKGGYYGKAEYQAGAVSSTKEGDQGV